MVSKLVVGALYILLNIKLPSEILFKHCTYKQACTQLLIKIFALRKYASYATGYNENQSPLGIVHFSSKK